MKNRIIELTTSVIGTILVYIGSNAALQYLMWELAHNNNATGSLILILIPIILGVISIILVAVLGNKSKLVVGIPLIVIGAVIILFSQVIKAMSQLIMGGEIAILSLVGGAIILIGGIIALVKK